MNPLTFPSDAAAVRSFQDAVNADGDMARHSEDYTLYDIGEWDPATGTITVDNRKSLAVGIHLKREAS